MKKITLFVLSLALALGVYAGLFGQTPLWTQDFADTAPAGWTVVNAGSGNDWSLVATSNPYSGTYHMQYTYNSTNDANTWAFTPGIAMTAGRDYYLTFWQKVQSASYPENLKVTVGNDQTVASQTTTVLTLDSLTNTTYAQRTTAYYRPTTSGTYYFAFNCYSAADMWLLQVDYVQAYEFNSNEPLFTISPNETSYDFGVVNVGSSVTRQYTITNAGGGSGSIDISTPLQTTGNNHFQVTVQPSDNSLAAGEYTTFTVTYQPLSIGAHSDQLVITYNTAKTIHTISFSGSGDYLCFSENWDGAISGWYVVQGSQTNYWTFADGTYLSPYYAAYITNSASLPNQYTNTATSVSHLYKDITLPAGSDFNLNFAWKCYGESGYDYLKVFLVETSVTPTAGHQLPGALGTYNLQANWQSASIDLNDNISATTKRLVFSWRNDSSGGYDPPAAIDDINISYTPAGPTIDLPEVFEFDVNGTLVVDFSQYVNDADGGTLTLGYSGNSNVNVSIDGLTVTFTATADWYGTENLTFTVSDGTNEASDTAVVIVHLTWLAVPGISISYVDAASDYVKVEWNAIPNANFYQVWGSNDPFGTYSFLGETTDAYWNDMDLGQTMRFYRIIASDESYLITK